MTGRRGAAHAAIRTARYLHPPSRPAMTLPVPVNPVEWGLVELWTRTAPGLTAAGRRRLAADVMAFVESRLWEPANLAQRGSPIRSTTSRWTAGPRERTSRPTFAGRPLGNAEIPPEVMCRRHDDRRRR
ncbi:terpene synthase family protein [Streptomyces humicola]|uniref:terpene synthase family protein n=1 Tax=Streptomyces humicola TaxID=2953240 RepID=UPI003558D96D